MLSSRSRSGGITWETFQQIKERFLNAKCIGLILETHHKIVDVTHQISFALQAALDHAFKPQVKYVMQIHVA